MYTFTYASCNLCRNAPLAWLRLDEGAGDRKLRTAAKALDVFSVQSQTTARTAGFHFGYKIRPPTGVVI